MVDPLLQVKNLTKSYAKDQLVLRGISFDLHRGESLGIVGESGCGKSTLAKAILKLVEATSGTIVFQGIDLTQASERIMRTLRSRLQIVFQDPFGSLNPRQSVRELIREPLQIHRLVSTKHGFEQRVIELLELVGLSTELMDRYPHELSGGQRQRIGIARALAVNPQLLVLDEPVSALDVSVQAQIINLLLDLQKKLSLTILLVAHDLRVVEYFADRTAVMYLGEIVERGQTQDVFERAYHPYTRALLSAVPTMDPRQRGKQLLLQGEISRSLTLKTGCPFQTRCLYVMDRCLKQKPVLEERTKNHWVSCFRLEL